MFRTLKSQHLNITAVVLVVLLVIWIFKQSNGQLLALSWQLLLALAVALFASVFNFWRFLKLKEAPISTIAAAAQGYVELYGQAKPLTELKTPYHSIPCVWYKAWVFANFLEKTLGNSLFNHRLLDYAQSHEPFILEDHTGQCIVNPQGAEVMYFQTRTWRKNDHRYVEQYLPVNRNIYIVGQLDTRKDLLDERVLNQALIANLKGKKANYRGLLHQYDYNQNDAIDEDEWEMVRQDAISEVQSKHMMQAHTQDFTIAKPKDKHLFLISAKSPKQLRQHHRDWLSIHLVFFIVLLSLCIKFG